MKYSVHTKYHSHQTSNSIQWVVLWICCFGSMVVFDPNLTQACRDAKDLFQLPFVFLFVGLRLWSTYDNRILGLRNSPAEWFAFFIILLGTIAYVRSPIWISVTSTYINIVVYTLLLFALRDFLERQTSPHKVFYPFLLGTLITSVYGIFQYFGIDPIFKPVKHFEEQRWVVAGFFGQQTLFAGVLGPLVGPAIYFALASKEYLQKSYFLLIGLVAIATIVLTHTRAVLFGLAVALMTVFLIQLLSNRKKMAFRTLFLLTFFSIVTALAFFSIPTFQKRISEGLTLKSASIKARMHYWRCTYELIKEKPILGWGLGTFPREYPAAQIAIRNQNTRWSHGGTEVVTHPHNELLLLLTEGGVVLLIFVLSLWGFILVQGIKLCLRSKTNQEILYKLGGISAFIVITIDSLFSFPFHIGTSALIAVVCSAYLITDNSRLEKEEFDEGQTYTKNKG